MPELAALSSVVGPASPEVEQARMFIRSSRSAATLRAYATNWRRFEALRRSRAVSLLPASPGAVGLFRTAEAQGGAGASTITRRSAAIRYMHESHRHASPTTDPEVLALVSGIRRTIGARIAQKAPVTAAPLAAKLGHCPDTLRRKRDRALLALGFSDAFRRSELVALEVQDLEETDHGLRVLIRRSKTDQEGRGHEIAILRGAKLRGVEALRAWLAAASITNGPIFRRVNKADRVMSFCQRHLNGSLARACCRDDRG